MKSKVKPKGITLKEEVIEKAKIIAKSENRTFSNLIETLLLKHIKEYESTSNRFRK